MLPIMVLISVFLATGSTISELKTEIKELSTEDQNLHGVISQHAFVQDRSQLELKDIEKKWKI